MHHSIRRTGVAVLLAAFGLFAAQASQAALIQGDYLGTFAGNDSEAQLLADLGVVVEELAKVDWPAESNDGLSVTDLLLDADDEPVSGNWSYAGPGTVDYIVIMAGGMYAVYQYTAANTGGMFNMGLWDTGDVDNKGLSHITAYTVVPIPAAAWMLVSALAGLGLVGRRRRTT